VGLKHGLNIAYDLAGGIRFEFAFGNPNRLLQALALLGIDTSVQPTQFLLDQFCKLVQAVNNAAPVAAALIDDGVDIGSGGVINFTHRPANHQFLKLRLQALSFGDTPDLTDRQILVDECDAALANTLKYPVNFGACFL